MDRQLGASIASTEAVFLALAEGLQARGMVVRRSIWLGETDGIYDSQGVTIGELRPDTVGDLLDQIQGASGTDVTGGMRLRLETATRLAGLGVESWIANGLQPGLLAEIMSGHCAKGTRVLAAPTSQPPS